MVVRGAAQCVQHRPRPASCNTKTGKGPVLGLGLRIRSPAMSTASRSGWWSGPPTATSRRREVFRHLCRAVRCDANTPLSPYAPCPDRVSYKLRGRVHSSRSAAPCCQIRTCSQGHGSGSLYGCAFAFVQSEKPLSHLCTVHAGSWWLSHSAANMVPIRSATPMTVYRISFFIGRARATAAVAGAAGTCRLAQLAAGILPIVVARGLETARQLERVKRRGHEIFSSSAMIEPLSRWWSGARPGAYHNTGLAPLIARTPGRAGRHPLRF
jgi:hypothetical protein